MLSALRRWVSDLLCFCGGANLSVLRQCPTERGKFHTLGLLVLNTAGLATVSMYFALLSLNPDSGSSDLAPSKGVLVLVALFWGQVIFAIDWGLIKTIRKHDQPTTRQQVSTTVLGIFRLAVAVLISFVISRPMETLVFKDYLPAERTKLRIEKARNMVENDSLSVANAEKQQRADREALIEQIAQKDALPQTDKYFEALRRDTTEKKELAALEDAARKSKEQAWRSTESERQILRQNEAQMRTRSNDRRALEGNLQAKIDEIAKVTGEISAIKSAEVSYEEVGADSVRTRQLTPRANQDIAERQRQIADLEIERSAIQQQLSSVEQDIKDLRADRAPFEQTVRKADQIIGQVNDEVEKKRAARSEATDQLNTVLQEHKTNKEDMLVLTQENYDSSGTALARYQRTFFERAAEVDSVTRISYSNNLISDLKTLESLSQSEDDGAWVNLVRWLILLLIILVDTAPILIKLIIKRGPYDELLEEEEDRRSFLSRQETYSNKHVIRELALAQKEVLNAAITQWKDQEVKRTDLAENHINTERPPRT